MAICKMESILPAILIVALSTPYIALAQDSGERICSVDEPRSDQVCISIKFPWKDEPVSFCTDHGTINYTPQCTDPAQSHHCHDDARSDTLKIATPWDCCPIISTPNRCQNVECPAEPFNRTGCKTIKILGDCCPTYFCEPGEPDNCKASRLRSSCMNPPKDKTNCIGYRDPYGCCNKYTCEGEGKPGVCPRHSKETRDIVEPTGTFERIIQGAKKTVNDITSGVKSTLENHGGDIGRSIAKVITIPFKSRELPVRLRCSGDYYCPGTMKCCRALPLGYALSNHRVTRRKSNGETRITNYKVIKAEHYPNQLIDGVCVEPDPEGTVYESTSPTYQDYPSPTWESKNQNEISSQRPYYPPRPTLQDSDPNRSPVTRPQPGSTTEGNSFVHE